MRSPRSVINITHAAFFLGLALPQFIAAADKFNIEIVESTSVIQLLNATIPDSPEQMDTHCSASATGSTTTEDCKTTVKPATQPTAGVRPLFRFSAKAILPDASHVWLMCFQGDKDCAGIATVEEKSTGNCETKGNTITCTAKDLGTYKAKRDKNDLVIYGPKGKLKYRIVGSW